MDQIVTELESTNIANEDPVEEEEEEEEEGTVLDAVEDTVEKKKITLNNIPKLNENSNWRWKLLTIENNDDNAPFFLDTGKMKTIFNDIHRKQKEIFEERVRFIKEYCILTFHSKNLFFSNNKICKFINDSVHQLSRIELNAYIETERQKDNEYILQNLERTKLLKSYSYKFHHAFYTALMLPLETILENLDQSSLKVEDKLMVEAIVATSLETYLLQHLYESQQGKTESRLKIRLQDINLEHNLVTSPRIRLQPSQLLPLLPNPIEFGSTTATNIPPYNLRTQTADGIKAVTTSIIQSGSSSSNKKRKAPSGKKAVSINKIPNNNSDNNNISNNLNKDNNSNDNNNDAIDQQDDFTQLQIDENNHALFNKSSDNIVESNEINDKLIISLANELKLDPNVIAGVIKALKIEVTSTDCDNQSSFDNSKQIDDASNDNNEYISVQEKEEQEQDVTDILSGEVPILNEYNFYSRSGVLNNNIGQPSLSCDLFYLITNDDQYLNQYKFIRVHKCFFSEGNREIYQGKVKKSNSNIVLKLQSLNTHKRNNCNINMIDIEYSIDNMQAEWSLFDTKINSKDCFDFLDSLASPSEDLLNTSCNFIDYFLTIIDQDFQLNQEEKDNVILCLSFVKEFILDGPIPVNHCVELLARLKKAPIIYIPILTNDVCALVIVEFSKQRKEVDVYYYDFYNQDMDSFNDSCLKTIIDDKVCKFIDLIFPLSYHQKRSMLKQLKIIPIPNFKEQIRSVYSGDKIKSVLLLCASLVSCLVFHDTSTDFASPFRPPEYEKWSSNFDFDMFKNLIFYTVIHRNLHDAEIAVSKWIDEFIEGLN